MGGSLVKPLAVDAPQSFPIDRRHGGGRLERPDVTGGDQQIEPETEIGVGFAGQGGGQLTSSSQLRGSSARTASRRRQT
jgi:hypothetical protein